MTNRIVRSICHFLIGICRRGVVPFPDIVELIHYATCGHCIRLLARQGCYVFLKRDGNRILEVTFTSKEGHDGILSSLMDEDHEEDEELEIQNHMRPSVREETLKKPKADFYIA